ncbi:MAG: hypothetical protein JSR17_04450 [Proteobacteria bacterium]|nr:hypothetical protein [Pseudomonadota bacterium]
MSKILNKSECQAVNGGIHLNLGTVISGIVVGFVTGGPVGVGIALSGMVISEGVNNLNELRQET